MEKAASILCVDCTAKMAGRSGMSSGTPMAKRPVVDLVELGVGVPGFVEVNARDGLGKLGDDAVHVVAEAVVGGVGHDGVGGLFGDGARR